MTSPAGCHCGKWDGQRRITVYLDPWVQPSGAQLELLLVSMDPSQGELRTIGEALRKDVRLYPLSVRLGPNDAGEAKDQQFIVKKTGANVYADIDIAELSDSGYLLETCPEVTEDYWHDVGRLGRLLLLQDGEVTFDRLLHIQPFALCCFP